MSYGSAYNGVPGLGWPWQQVKDDAAAVRMYIEHLAREFGARDAWIVTETGGGQWFTAFSAEAAANAFAATRQVPHEDAMTIDPGEPQPRVLVNQVRWPDSRSATVISYMDDSAAEDYLLVLPPVPSVAYGSPEFRSYGVGGPDNVVEGYVGVLELDGGTELGGW